MSRREKAKAASRIGRKLYQVVLRVEFLLPWSKVGIKVAYYGKYLTSAVIKGLD